MAGKSTLTPTDWIKAGFRALSAGGPQGINVEAIARALRVSKGSFYWHFKDIAAFRAAMLHHWVQVATDDIIARIKSDSSTPEEHLESLVQIATGANTKAYGGRLAEAAIRDWARFDRNAAAARKDVDAKRLQFLKTLFRDTGCSQSQAAGHADIFYAALIGLEQLHHLGANDRRKALTELLRLLLKSR